MRRGRRKQLEVRGDECWAMPPNAKEVSGHALKCKGGTRRSKFLIKLFAPQGAGHMVPTDKPRAAFTMFSRFLNREPY